MPKKKKEAQQEINFEEVSEELANVEHRQHIDQIAAALSDTYLQHAKYTDEKGVIRFKKKFTGEEARKLGHGLYDTLAYHSHRRVFGIDEEQYKALAKFKDPNGNPYIDVVTQYHFNLPRQALVKDLAKDDEENTITHEDIQKIMKEKIKHHGDLLTQGIISKHGLDEPEHMDKVKTAIDKIVETYKLPKKRFDTSKIYTPNEVLQTYVSLASAHYKEGAREREKKKAA